MEPKSEATIVDEAREKLELVLASCTGYNAAAEGIRLATAVRSCDARVQWDGKFGGVIGRPGLRADSNLREAITAYMQVRAVAVAQSKAGTRGQAKLPGI